MAGWWRDRCLEVVPPPGRGRPPRRSGVPARLAAPFRRRSRDPASRAGAGALDTEPGLRGDGGAVTIDGHPLIALPLPVASRPSAAATEPWRPAGGRTDPARLERLPRLQDLRGRAGAGLGAVPAPPRRGNQRPEGDRPAGSSTAPGTRSAPDGSGPGAAPVDARAGPRSRARLTPMRLAVYGATGRTGRIVVSGLGREGVECVVGGRNATRLAELANEPGVVEAREASVEDPRSLRDLLEAAASSSTALRQAPPPSPCSRPRSNTARTTLTRPGSRRSSALPSSVTAARPRIAGLRSCRRSASTTRSATPQPGSPPPAASRSASW